VADHAFIFFAFNRRDFLLREFDIGGIAVVTTIAGGFATWLVSRHYDDLSQSYTIMAHKLLEFETRAASILPESQARGASQQASWAAFINEVEAFLDGEHQVWLREIAQKQEVAQAAASQSGE